MTRLSVEDSEDRLKYDDLVSCLERALHMTQGLLKRPDEAEMVLKAHQRPQFAEDIVRETAREAGRMFKDKLLPSSEITVESLSLESIHIHNVRAVLKTNLGRIVEASSRTDPE